MTRDGAISVNMVTGEASHVSDRAPEQDYSPSGDSTALARTALHHLDDRRVRKSQKKKRRNRRKAYREGTAANSRHPPVCNSPRRNAPRRSCKKRSANPTRRRTSWTRHEPPFRKSASWARSVSLTRLPAPGVQGWYSMRRISRLRSGSRGRTRWRGLCRRSPTPPMPRCGRWSRRTPAWRRAISPSAAWKKPWAMGTASCKTGGRSGR